MPESCEETPFQITPESHFIVITQRAGEELRQAIPDLRGSFDDQRALLIGAMGSARVLPATIQPLAVPRPQRQGTGLVLGRCWLALHLDAYAVELHWQCQVVTGSPAGWQRYTALLEHPHVVGPERCAQAAQDAPGRPCAGPRPVAWDDLVAENLTNSRHHAQALATDPRRWRASLVAVKQALEAAFAEHRALARQEEQACWALGPRGKARWLAFQAQEEAWRAKARRRITVVDARLRELAALRQTTLASEGRRLSHLPGHEGIAFIHARLQALLDDDQGWTTNPISQGTRARLRLLLEEMAQLLARTQPVEESHHAG
jgi:hypothetical protein